MPTSFTDAGRKISQCLLAGKENAEAPIEIKPSGSTTEVQVGMLMMPIRVTLFGSTSGSSSVSPRSASSPISVIMLSWSKTSEPAEQPRNAPGDMWVSDAGRKMLPWTVMPAKAPSPMLSSSEGRVTERNSACSPPMSPFTATTGLPPMVSGIRRSASAPAGPVYLVTTAEFSLSVAVK